METITFTGDGIPKGAICVDCRTAPARWLVPARHSFDAAGKPNGSKEAVCANCADERRADPGPIPANVYCFAGTVSAAQEIAKSLNLHKVTRRSGPCARGEFIAGSFTVDEIPGRVPAVVGKLAGVR